MFAQIQLEPAIEALVDKVGFPCAVLIALGLVAWRACKWWAPILTDWGNRIVTAHERLVNSTIAIGETNSKTLGELNAGQGRIESTLEAIRSQQAEMHRQNHAAA